LLGALHQIGEQCVGPVELTGFDPNAAFDEAPPGFRVRTLGEAEFFGATDRLFQGRLSAG